MDETEVSKSQRKRNAKAITRLGEALVALSPAQLDELDLSNELRDAIASAKKIHQHGGLKRQLQYIGKLLRNTDVTPIVAQMDALAEQQNAKNRAFHQWEEWRDKLIEEGDDGIATLMQIYPQADRPFLRQVTRKARQEREQNNPPAAARKLFRYLRDLMSEQSH